MALEPQTKAYLEQAAKAPRPADQTMKQARAAINKKLTFGDFPIHVGNVEDIRIPFAWGKLMARVYTPEGSGPFPIVVYYHGGGWVYNNVGTHDSVCRHMAKLSDCIFISIEYRLAPETKFPGPVEDSYGALEWIYDNAVSLNGIPDKLAVAGDSAGGNLAAATCLLARDRKGPDIKLQVLMFPVTDHYSTETKSYFEVNIPGALNGDQMIWFWDLYLNKNEDVNNPYISPLRAKSLKNLPPAIITTAENDPLLNEGEAYAKRLQDAGVPVTYSCCSGVVHAYILQWRILDKAMASIREISSGIKKHMYSL